MRMNMCAESNCEERVTSYFPQPPRAFAATAAATRATDGARFGSTPSHNTRSQLNTTVSEEIYSSFYLVSSGPPAARVSF